MGMTNCILLCSSGVNFNKYKVLILDFNQMSENRLIKELGNLEKSKFTYPSPIVAFNLQVEGKTIEIKIPKDELSRVKEIFQGHDYSILLQRRYSGSRVIVDIGANVGIFSIYMKMNYPDSRIYCFEPVPSTFDLLQKNLESISNTLIFPFGLFNDNRPERIQLHSTNTGASTIKVQDKYKNNFTNSVEIELKKASAIFDELNIEKIDILKIDTEGCEVEILDSISSRLPNIDYALLEYHSEADRRKIDQLLSDFYLYSSKALMMDLGLVKYINSKLVK